MRSPSHTRVAVAQLDYVPAIVRNRKSALGDPAFMLGRPDSLWSVKEPEPAALEQPLRNLRASVRKAYVDQHGAKLQAVVEACRGWGVEVLVLPEYGVPWELLSALAQAAGDMVLVAGTHMVERSGRQSGIYAQLGWSEPPTPGTAVAPVLHRGRLLALPSKLSTAEPERGALTAGQTWSPVVFDPETGPAIVGPMGVLIGSDFLWRERATHRDRVGPALHRTRFLAVPSYTPAFTTEEFGAKGWEEARQYGRPVLYANHSSGGGTSVFVDGGQPPEPSRFPERVERLEAGEEGVVVADVDLAFDRTGTSTRHGGAPVVVPVAAASLVYRMHPKADEYAEWSIDLARRLESGGEPSLDDLAEHVEASARLLSDASSLRGARPRKRRLQALLAGVGGITRVEQVAQLTREVVLPPRVLPHATVCAGVQRAAADVIGSWFPEHRGLGMEAVEQRLRKRAAFLDELRASEWTEAARDVFGVMQRRVSAAGC